MNKRNCGAKFYIRKVKFASNKTSTFKISQEMDDGKLMFKVNFLLYSALCDNQIVVIILVLFSKAEKGFCVLFSVGRLL